MTTNNKQSCNDKFNTSTALYFDMIKNEYQLMDTSQKNFIKFDSEVKYFDNFYFYQKECSTFENDNFRNSTSVQNFLG